MKLSTLTFTLLIGLFIYSITKAQIINPRRTAERKAEDRANQKIDRGIDKGLDKIEGVFKKKDRNNKDNSENNNQNQDNNNSPNQNQGNPSSPNQNQGNNNTTSGGDTQGGTSLKSYAQSDFIPGEHTLFFDDFSNALNHWNRITWDEWEESDKGKVTSVNASAGSWYFMPRKGMTAPKNLGALPDQFTLEFDMMSDENHTENEGGVTSMFIKYNAFDINSYDFYFDRAARATLDVHPYGTWLSTKVHREYGYTKGFDEREMIFKDTKSDYWTPNKVHRISISKNGSHVKLYVNQDLLIDLPNALPANEKYTFCLGNNSWIKGLYVSNVRLATGIPQPSKDLKEKKAYITRNIHFEVNSDKIKPNSYPILKGIAQAIQEIDGKILIVGHTDSDGNTENNMELSKKRALAVKNALSSEFGVDASRLETDGKGAAEPSEPNTTPQGKANNRRVEFIKL